MSFERKPQSLVFGEVAEVYHRYRPGYPDELFEWILTTCQTLTTDLIVDVGCGTGKASAPLIARGYEILGLEPDPAMASIALRELQESGLFSIEEATLDGWPGTPRKAGLVIAGQAWHWTNPATRFQRVGSMLRSNGWLCVFWNRPEQRELPFDAATDLIYAELAPEFTTKPYPVRLPGSKAAISAETPTEEIDLSGLFGPVEEFQMTWELDVSTNDHIQNLRTQSDHRMLKPSVLDDLLMQVAKRIDLVGGSYRQPFTTHAYAAKLSI